MAGVMKKLECKGDKGDKLTLWQERYNMLLFHENHIRADIKKVRECFVYIGYHLMDIDEQQLYRYVYYQASGEYCTNVFQYSLQELSMSKSTVYNLMAVARTFSDERRGLKPEYADYSYSQLVEMLAIPSEAIKFVSPYMSVKDIRELKKGKKVSYTDKNDLFKDSQIPAELIEKFQTSGKTEEAGAELRGQVSIELPESFQTSGKDISFSDGILSVDVAESKQPDELMTEKADILRHNLGVCLAKLRELWIYAAEAYTANPTEELRCIMNKIQSIEWLCKTTV